jgi:aspartate dehydrogenase
MILGLDRMLVGLIGYGNIGKELAKFLDGSEFFELKYICDVFEFSDPRRAQLDDLINGSDLIIEAAGKAVVEQLLTKNLTGKKLMILSTGGLIGKDISNLDLYIPSGAIAGIDALKAVAGLIDVVKLVTTKAPQRLEGAPFVVKNCIDLNSIDDKKVIFSGTLREAILGFPKNVNVAATISLAVGQEIDVEVVVDPHAKRNTHQIICVGSFGKLNLLIENVPSSNPKTSYLAVLSAIQCLNNISGKVMIGS